MAVDRWSRTGSRNLHDCKVFRLNQVEFQRSGSGSPQPFYVLDAPDWINVIPILPDRQIVMIRQFRFGVEGETLEIPGGMCDPGESPLESARRELLEETGFSASSLTPLGSVHPNPAIQSNHCHTFLATGLTRVAEPDPDPNEGFEEQLVPLDEIPGLISSGVIEHSLVVAAFYHLDHAGLELRANVPGERTP
jgi:ADP-ribose pyrophosphatase